jgi:hypothetical protein
MGLEGGKAAEWDGGQDHLALPWRWTVATVAMAAVGVTNSEGDYDMSKQSEAAAWRKVGGYTTSKQSENEREFREPSAWRVFI